MTTVGRNKPPPSLSVHAQCFWEFTPTERRIMKYALDDFLLRTIKDTQAYRVTQILRDALHELSTQD